MQHRLHAHQQSSMTAETSIPVHLLIPYFSAKGPRKAEYDNALVMNLKNSAVAAIHLLLESDSDNPKQLIDMIPEAKGRVHTKVLGHRFMYSDAVEYGNANIKDATVMLINADIFTDSSLKLLQQIDLAPAGGTARALFLSRYGQHPDGTMDADKCATGIKYSGCSADTWAWKSPLACAKLDELRKGLRYELGFWHGENRFLYSMQHYCNIESFNPCKSIITHHVHSSNIRKDRKYVENKVEENFPYKCAKPICLSEAPFNVANAPCRPPFIKVPSYPVIPLTGVEDMAATEKKDPTSSQALLTGDVDAQSAVILANEN